MAHVLKIERMAEGLTDLEKHVEYLNGIEKTLHQMHTIELVSYEVRRGGREKNKQTLKRLKGWSRLNVECVTVKRFVVRNDPHYFMYRDSHGRADFAERLVVRLKRWPRPVSLYFEHLPTPVTLDHRKQAIEKLFYTTYDEYAHIQTQKRSLFKALDYCNRRAPFKKVWTQERIVLKILRAKRDSWKRYLNSQYKADKWSDHIHNFVTDYHRLNWAAVRMAQKVYTLIMMSHRQEHALWGRMPRVLIRHILMRYCKAFHWSDFDLTRTVQNGQWMDEIFYTVKRIRQAKTFISFESVKQLRRLIDKSKLRSRKKARHV